jgi:hypothetical protein
MVKDANNEIEIVSTVLSCDEIFSKKRDFLRLESNEMFEISMVVNGSGIHSVLDKDIPSKKGDIFVIPSNTPHGFFVEKEDDLFVIRRLFWNPEDWLSGECANHSNRRYCYGIFRESSTLAYAVLNATVFDDIGYLWNIIESEVEMQKEEYREAIRGVLSYFLITISRYINSSVKNLSFESYEEWNIVSNAIKIIREEYYYAEQIRGLADKYNVGLADSFEAYNRNILIESDLSKYLSHTNHPTKAGHQLVADEIAKYFIAR